MHKLDVAALARLPLRWKQFLRVYYNLPPKINIAYPLAQRRLTHDHIVRVLLKRRYGHVAIQAMTGVAVTVCPSHMPRHVCAKVHKPLCWRDSPIRALFRAKCDRSPYGGRFYVGATPRALAAAGVPWRVLVRAKEQGWMEL